MRIIAFCVCLLFAVPCLSQDEVKIGVYPSAPFIMEGQQDLAGFDAELWEAIASHNNWKSEIVIVNTFEDLLEGIESGDFDAAISNITINSDREQRIDFSHPYMESGLGILVASDGSNGFMSRTVGTIKSFSPVFPVILGAFGAYLAILLVFGFFMWLFDRGSKESGIPDSFTEGFPLAAWCAHATASTVGYGDVAPRRTGARLFSIVAFFGGAIFISYLTSVMTSHQVVTNLSSEINGPQDLEGKIVGTVKGSTSVAAIQKYGGIVSDYGVIEEAYADLVLGKVDAVVFDMPRLKYFALNDGAGAVNVAGRVFDEQSYGIAFKQGSRLRESANISLLELREQEVHQDLVYKYFGNE